MAFLNEQGLERLWTHILAKLNTKVEKVEGKDLSTNDYTNEDKETLANTAEKINEVGALVGDASVSEQINDAINNLDIPEGFSGSWVDITDKPFYSYDADELVGWTNGTMVEPADNTAPSTRFVYTASREFCDTYVARNQTIDIDIESMGMGVINAKNVEVKRMLYNNVDGYIYGCGNIALYDGTSFVDFLVDTEETDEDYLILFDTRGYYTDSTDETVNVILTTNNATLTSGQARYVGLRLRKNDTVTKYVCIEEPFIPDTIARVSDIPARPKMTSITLSASNWSGNKNPWAQLVVVNGSTANSKIDLQPTADQIVELQENDIAFITENVDGVVHVYAIGNKPTVDYTIQALITEVDVV